MKVNVRQNLFAFGLIEMKTVWEESFVKQKCRTNPNCEKFHFLLTTSNLG